MADKEVTTKIMLQGDSSGVTSALDKTQDHLKKTDSAVGGLDRSVLGLNGQFTSLTGVTRLVGGAFAGLGLTAIASQLHAAGMSSERLRNSFEAATGDVQKGADAYAYARNEAQRLGLDLQSAADAYLKITASAKGSSLEGEKTQKIFSSVAGASRALGLGAEEMNGALLAISQMMSKGVVQSEELRGQLGERIPQSFQIAARAMGVTTAELGKMLESGKVMAEDFLPKFAAELEKTFPPGEKAMSGLTAETERLKTAFYELKTTVMDSGGDSIFSGAIRGMRVLTEEASLFVKTLGKTDSRLLGLLMPGVMYGTSIATGAKDDNKALPPLSRTDKLLSAGTGDFGFSTRTDSLFTPQFPNRMRSPDEYTEDFGANLNRNTPYEDPKKKTGSKKPDVYADGTDLLQDNILSYTKDMEKINTLLIAESSALAAGGSFAAATFDSELSTGGRYKKSGTYSLMGTGPNQVKQEIDPNRSIEEALDKRYTESAFRSVQTQRNQESLESERIFLAEQAAARGDSTSLELARITREQQALEQSWAMNTDSFEVYEQRKAQITEFYEQQKTRIKQSESQKQMQMAASGFNSMATIADAFYQLSGKKSKEAFKAYQITKSMETAVTTHSTAMKAYGAMASIPYVGPALGIAAAAAAYAAGAVAINGIWSASAGGSLGSGSNSAAGSAGSSPVTQPVSAPPAQQAPIFQIHFNGTTLADPQALTRWSEDYLMPTIRDLKTRGVTA